MRSRTALLGLAIMIVLGAAAYLLSGGTTSDGGPAGPVASTPPPVPVEDPRLAQIAGPADGSDVDRERAEMPVTHEPSVEAEQVDPVSPTGFAVTGSVSFDDGPPAPGVSFVLRHPKGYVVLETDGEGRFRSEPVIAPGIVKLLHRVSDVAGPQYVRLQFEPGSMSLEGEVGDEVEVALTLRRPEAELLVRVVHRDGSPATDARVELEVRHEVRAGEFERRLTPARADASGQARFGLFDLHQLREAGVRARLEVDQDGEDVQHLVSPHVALPLKRAPLFEPVVLVLGDTGSLLVRVRDEAGAPVSEEQVRLSAGATSLGAFRARSKVTDGAGEALFEGLPPGDYRVSHAPRGGDGALSAVVWPAQLTDLVVVVTVDERRLGVAGRVVDEEGAPLARVLIRATFEPGGVNSSVSTDAEGRFEIQATPGAKVTVHSNRALFGDEYDPASIEVPFGSAQVLFTRVRTVEREEVAFEIVDALGGERLPGALVMSYRAPNLGDYSFHHAQEGLATPLLALHPDTTLVVEKNGYRRMTVTLDELLAQEPVNGLRRLALDSGLLRVLHVEGSDVRNEEHALAGARVRLGARELGVTDARGELLLDLHAWPETALTIEAEGYVPTRWEPSGGYAEVEPAWVWLERE